MKDFSLERYLGIHKRSKNEAYLRGEKIAYFRNKQKPKAVDKNQGA